MLITLDKSQAGGTHEKTLLDADRKHVLAKFNTYFAIGQSSTHQISHTKGFVADAKVGGEGSVNWSAAGEGTFVVTEQPGGPGFKAQNNTQTIFHRSGLSASISGGTDRGTYDRGESTGAGYSRPEAAPAETGDREVIGSSSGSGLNVCLLETPEALLSR